MHPGQRPAPAAFLTLAGLLFGSLGWAASLSAQTNEDDFAAPPFVAAVEGTASVLRDGALDEVSLHLPLIDGDRLRTGEGSRLEILWVDGRRLWLDERSTLDLVGEGLVRLVDGRLRARSSEAVWRIETSTATVRTVTAADVIVAVVDSPERRAADVAVVSGGVRVVTARGEVPLGRGQRVVADAFDAVPAAETWDLAWRDTFLAWADSRVDETRTASASAAYLPDTLQTFSGTLERYGEWQAEPTYGQVWYPAVDPGWAPYTLGAWQRVGYYGSVWVGVDPWAWPTHHYGRWGLNPAGRWYWIPSRGWSPGWVSWVVGPGYVGWAPLGWYDRPVHAWGAWGTWGGSWTSPYSPWRGWTVVPSHRLWSRGRVGTYAVDVGRLAPHQRSAFVAQRAAPKPGRGYGPGGPGTVSGDGPRDAYGRQRVPPTTRYSAGSTIGPSAGRSSGAGMRGPTRAGGQGVAPETPGRRVMPSSRGAGTTTIEPRRDRPVDAQESTIIRRRPPGASGGAGGRVSYPAGRGEPGTMTTEPRRERPSDAQEPATIRRRAPDASGGGNAFGHRPAERATPRVDRVQPRSGGSTMSRPASPQGAGSSASRPPASRGSSAGRGEGSARGGATRRPPR